MSEEPNLDNPSPTPPPSGLTQSNTVMVIYILYLVGFTAPITAIVGVVFAYMSRDQARDTWMESHYEFQIRTFWMGLGMAIVGGLLAVIGIGVLILIFWFVWAIIRSAKGLMWYSKGEPVPDPMTRLW
ncbi:MAG: hypothetical protein HOH89_01465 [Alphaproteobacteria bacterium]|nr:hypothetical protein [Alphaproteobacteria bacterium]